MGFPRPRPRAKLLLPAPSPLAAGSCDAHAEDTLMPATSAAIRPTPSRTAHEFTVDDVEYLSHGGSPLLLRLF